MVNNKKIKKKKVKKEIIYRTKEQRENEVKEILNQLTSFNLNMKYEPIKKLYNLFRIYINDDKRIDINIPFPEINRRIKGLLARNIREEVWINLKNENF